MAKNLTVDSTSVVIANGATVSSAISIPAAKRLIAFITPSALTSTAITFQQSCDDGVTYVPVYNESTLYSITVSTSRYHRVVAEVFDAARVIKFVGGTTEGGARTIIAILGEN